MPRTTVFIVSDDFETIERAKNYFGPLGVNVTSYTGSQWKDGMLNPQFRNQLVHGIPSLAGGVNPLEPSSSSHSNVLPFPTLSATPSHDVSTMNEIEGKAIENAILQFRGNLTEAAKALGIGRATLYRKVKQYHIDPSVARKKRAA